MNYEEYIDFLRVKIIDEKLNGKRYNLIRKYQKELDMVIEQNKKGQFSEMTIADVQELEPNDTIKQLETYLDGLNNLSRTHKDKLIEERFPADGKPRFINLQERLTVQELSGIEAEIEFIKNQIKILKDGNR